MTAPALTYIPDILEEHLEELGFLWGLRRTALRSPLYSPRAFTYLEERIVGHLDGILADGAPAFHTEFQGSPPDIQRFLRDDDPAVRLGGWRVAGCLGLRLDAKTYAAALRDAPAVRRAALHAGAWSGEPGILAVGRKF